MPVGRRCSCEHNAWLPMVATVGVVAAGILVRVGPDDWLWLVAAMATVWIAEGMNDAFEHLCDVVSPNLHAPVHRSKDVAARAVLISALAAALIGAVTFWPYVK